MSEQSIVLSKFDVAERQFNQAVSLFFDRADPVSIHTLAEASFQVLYDIRVKFDGVSLVRDSEYVRPERKKEWNGYMVASRNFFKHADRDPDEVHEFKDVFNHFSLIDAANLYLTAKKAWTSETLLYVSWFFMAYPDLIDEESALGAHVAQVKSRGNQFDITDFRTIALALKQLKSGELSLPGLSL